jgi:uncharacterized protein
MAQRWNDLLFAHWPVPLDALRKLVPSTLPIDVYEGASWISIAPFHISHLRPRGVPPFPGISSFPELNVRTYVTLDHKPGVYFFSLDAGSWLAVMGARLTYHLPYFHAVMDVRVSLDRTVSYQSRRDHAGAPAAELVARYSPTGSIYRSTPGSLEHWLTERYCLYAADRSGAVYRAEIHHQQWPLQPATLELTRSSMAAAAGLELAGSPAQLSYTRELDVLVWWPERVR